MDLHDRVTWESRGMPASVFVVGFRRSHKRAGETCPSFFHFLLFEITLMLPTITHLMPLRVPALLSQLLLYFMNLVAGAVLRYWSPLAIVDLACLHLDLNPHGLIRSFTEHASGELFESQNQTLTNEVFVAKPSVSHERCNYCRSFNIARS